MINYEFKGKWIHIRPNATTNKTGLWRIYADSGEIIGEIKWYGPFRKYSFFPYPQTVYEQDCLKEITNFIVFLMEARKQLKKAAPVVECKHDWYFVGTVGAEACNKCGATRDC